MEGYPCLLSSGAPDSPMHHRTGPVDCPVRDLLPNLAYPTVAPLGWLAHRSLSGARADCWSSPRVDRRFRCRPLAMATVGSPDSPVNYSHIAPLLFPESDEFAADDSPDSPVHHRTVRWIIAVRLRRIPRPTTSPEACLGTGHCPVHHRAVQCARPSCSFGCTEPSLFGFFSPSFVAVSST
jgi:hypothetical protein